jgi:hypothetical protein
VRSVVAAMQAYRYAGQMSWYRRVMRAAGLAVEEVRLVFVDTAAPHDVIVVLLDESWMAYGDRLVDEALGAWQDVQAGIIRGVAPDMVIPVLPGWLEDDEGDMPDLEMP